MHAVSDSGKGLTGRLADSLLAETALLGDAARAYLDAAARPDWVELRAPDRMALACEALKLTTRLRLISGWLAAQRDGVPLAPPPMPATDAATLVALPEAARALIVASLDLQQRVARLSPDPDRPGAVSNPVRGLLRRIESSL